MGGAHGFGGRGGRRGHPRDNLNFGAEGKISRAQVFKTIIRLWHYLARYKGRILFLVFLTVISNILALLGPMLSGRAIDAIVPGSGSVIFERVFYYAGWMALFYVISAALNYLLSFNMISLSRNCAKQMRKEVFDKLMVLPVSYFDKNQTGDILSRISYDIDTVNTSLANDLIQICTTLVTVSGSLFMMFTISPLMGLIFLITVPLTSIFVKRQSSRVHSFFRIRSAKLGALNGYVEEIVSGQKTIKAYNREKITISRFDRLNDEAVNSYYEADYHAAFMGPSVQFINNISLSLISVFGAILYLFGNISLGSMSAFILYSRRFSGPINEAANIFTEIQSAAAAADRIFTLLDEMEEKPDADDSAELENVMGKVELSNISFGYLPDRPVLQDVNLEAAPGSLIAIVGQTGAGKTTIINLLMRFYDPDSGKISIDDLVIDGVTRKSLRLAFAMVLQESWLFHGTVFENIAYGNETATMEMVENAAKAAQAHNFIMQLPMGYNTILSENGVNISQGQKQLLTIARAMLLNVRMLILDEATSNVDTRTEIRIQEAMRYLMKNKTCFVIAHRLSTIQNADKILVMEKGSFAEMGTHDELLEKDGVYAGLYKSQFG